MVKIYGEVKPILETNKAKTETIKKALEYSKKKLKEKLDTDEYISDYKILNKEVFSDSITLNIFYSVIENITEYQEIEEYSELEEKENS